jgi:hypothetical protein
MAAALCLRRYDAYMQALVWSAMTVSAMTVSAPVSGLHHGSSDMLEARGSRLGQHADASACARSLSLLIQACQQ